MDVKEILKIKGKILYTTAPDRILLSVINDMAELDIGSFVVMDKGALVGMVTFREIFKLITNKGGFDLNIPVGEVMVKNPRVGSLKMSLDELRRIMVSEHIRYLPVLDKNTLVGVLSFHDVAKAMLEVKSFENEQLLNYLQQ